MNYLFGMFLSATGAGVYPLTVSGSWYRGDEIARRGGMFYVGLSLGTMTAGFIQSSASATLEGVHGLAGWRWSTFSDPSPLETALLPSGC